MRNFFVAGLLAVGAVASPLVERATTCMTTKNAVQVAQNFRSLIHDEFNKVSSRREGEMQTLRLIRVNGRPWLSLL